MARPVGRWGIQLQRFGRGAPFCVLQNAQIIPFCAGRLRALRWHRVQDSRLGCPHFVLGRGELEELVTKCVQVSACVGLCAGSLRWGKGSLSEIGGKLN